MNTLFHTLFSEFPEPMGLVDVDGIVRDVNPAWERVMGWTRAEAVGTSQAELGGWLSPEHRVATLAALVATGEYQGVVQIRRGDGQLIEREMTLRRLAHDGVEYTWFRLRDLSEEQRELHTRALSEARLRAFGMATFEGLAMSESGKLVDCNDQLAALFGYTVDELVGVPIASLSAPSTRELVHAAVSGGLEGPYEHIGIRKDGSTIPIEVRARMMKLGDRTFRFTAVRDLSDRIRTEQELQRLVSELRARNTEMEQFVYTVSHDLKSPLVTIKGFVGAIDSDLEAQRYPNVRSDLGRIRRAADRMGEFLDDLLELSRVGRVGTATTRVDLAGVARSALELVQGALTTTPIEVTISVDLPPILGDRGRLIQVVQNLLENAIKYIGDQKAPKIEIGSRATAERAVMFVRDNGKGIAPEYAERVFGLFEKLDPKSEGTGVGLALVRRIVEFHGGKVWVESNGPGQGSTFVIDIPLVPPPAP